MQNPGKGFKILWCLVITVCLFACKPEKEPDHAPSLLEIEIVHHWKGELIDLNKKFYVTDLGDSLKISTLIYHINNFSFGINGNKEMKNQGYFMVDEELGESKKISFSLGESEGTLSKLNFTIGVEDSTVNETGALNPIFLNPMYWGMVQGYINFKLEVLNEPGCNWMPEEVSK